MRHVCVCVCSYFFPLQLLVREKVASRLDAWSVRYEHESFILIFKFELRSNFASCDDTTLLSIKLDNSRSVRKRDRETIFS